VYPSADSFRVFTIKTDLNGEIILTKIFSSNYLQYVPSIIKENNNKFYLSFWTNTASPLAGSKIISIDSSLNILKQIAILPDTHGLALFSLFKIANSTDIMGCGRTDQFQIQGNTEMYAVRLDSSLNPPPPIEVKSISNNIPVSFKLHQNFPNPFNPVTEIKYELPINTNVTIKIYDLIGREIAALVNNKFESAGSHEVEWNASNYASSVYIYTIEAGKFFDSKKMVLIK